MPEFEDIEEQTIKTAFNHLDYCRQTLTRKGFSDDPAIKEKCLIFADQDLLQTRSRVYYQMYINEIWEMKEAHTKSYIIVREDDSGQYLSENL